MWTEVGVSFIFFGLFVFFMKETFCKVVGGKPIKVEDEHFCVMSDNGLLGLVKFLKEINKYLPQ